MTAISARRFTRKKCRAYSYVWSRQGRTKRGVPALKTVRFQMGDTRKGRRHQWGVDIVAARAGNILDNALEAVRLKIVRKMASEFGKKYYAKIKTVPHHIFRQHRQSMADRTSTGMRRSFGIPLVRSARVKTGQVIVQLRYGRQMHPTAIGALTRTIRAQLPVKTVVLARGRHNVVA